VPPVVELGAEAEALLAAPMPTALEDVQARATLIRGLLARLEPAVEMDQYSATSYVAICRYADELARLLEELTPEPPKDPDEDPDVIEAERILCERLERLIVEAEQRKAGSR
jgi:hypothetical protein